MKAALRGPGLPGNAYADFLASRGFGAMWAGPREFGEFMARQDADKGAVMKAVGLSK